MTSIWHSSPNAVASRRSVVTSTAFNASAKATYMASQPRTVSHSSQARASSGRCPKRSPKSPDPRSLGSPPCGPAVLATAHAGQRRKPPRRRHEEPPDRGRRRAGPESVCCSCRRSGPRRDTRRQRPASGQLPRCSSRAAMISVCVIGAERRRVRCSVMKWCSATARAYRSTTSTVASAAPRNGAMRSAAVSIAFSVDRVTRTNGSTVTTSRRAFLVDRHTPTT